VPAELGYISLITGYGKINKAHPDTTDSRGFERTRITKEEGYSYVDYIQPNCQNMNRTVCGLEDVWYAD
jgi:hypothetical protein